MITNPNATTVLCYGDSNTYGTKPTKDGRFGASVRWTGQLQSLLGNDYYVIEEGLSSRTTDLDYKRPGRNGKTYLTPCLASHNPLDVVVLMLGTNDLKIAFDRSASEVATAIEGLVADIREVGKDKNEQSPRVIIVSPVLIDDTVPRFTEWYTDYYNHDSAATSRALAGEIEKVASKTGCVFLDAAKVAKPGEDGLHIDESSQRRLAELIAGAVREG